MEIEKNVPPPRKGGKYPFRTMAVGDSFFIEYKLGNSARAMAAKISRTTDRKFTSRIDGEGYRIWRTE